MKHARLLCVLATSLFVFLAFGAAALTNDHVVLITIDGGAAFYLEDPAAPLPTLRKLAVNGATAQGMRVANPSITWPNHTTLVTGVYAEKHSVLFNGVLVRPGVGLGVSVDPRRDKSDLVAVPTLFDHLHKKGYRTAGINWPCTRNSGTLDDDFPDSPDTLTYTTPRLLNELVSAGILRDGNNTNFSRQSAASRDQVWTAAAAHVIRTRKPNLMLFHMLITDGIQHRYGPRTPAAYTALAQADFQLREILAALEQAGIRERTTLFIVADHGFETSTNIINPNVLLRKAGLLNTNLVSINPPRFKARVQIVSEGGTALVYFTDPQTKAQDRATALELFRGADGIAEILEPDSFAKLGLPMPDKNQQMADLILVPKPGHGFANNAAGDNLITPVTLASGSLGNHGYLASNTNMNALFVASGRGIKRGVKLGLVDNRSVAPTIAHLLGQKMPDADGKVLTEILE
ncbi:MAG TPA: ectonucleotide pyrophosphatase/phosphodiesterase [Methylomirabilota bacterium]|nr:ectonucleotide pyrophosphatase/phosphodiesterase [Methylomirabilota bacterium]